MRIGRQCVTRLFLTASLTWSKLYFSPINGSITLSLKRLMTWPNKSIVSPGESWGRYVPKKNPWSLTPRNSRSEIPTSEFSEERRPYKITVQSSRTDSITVCSDKHKPTLGTVYLLVLTNINTLYPLYCHIAVMFSIKYMIKGTKSTLSCVYLCQFSAYTINCSICQFPSSYFPNLVNHITFIWVDHLIGAQGFQLFNLFIAPHNVDGLHIALLDYISKRMNYANLFTVLQDVAPPKRL